MLRSIEGIYQNGKIELLEKPDDQSPARVIVTFLSGNEIDLRKRNINEAEAADMRNRLQTFAEDWNRPDMDVYDAL